MDNCLLIFLGKFSAPFIALFANRFPGLLRINGTQKKVLSKVEKGKFFEKDDFMTITQLRLEVVRILYLNKVR